MNRLLVTGASGFLGWHLCRLAQTDWQVVGTYHHHPVVMPGVQMDALDLTAATAVTPYLQTLAPDAVIHAAALSQPNRCQQQPELSYAINVEATSTLATYCGERGIPLVFTSTDQVFDGTAAPYAETARPQPINTYGQHKAVAEQRLAQFHPAATICRLPLLYGGTTPNAQSFLQGFLRHLSQGQPLKLFTDEFRSPAHVEDVALGLLLALGHPGRILHLGGPERISRYEFGQHLVNVFGFDPALILPSRQADVPMAAPRPADVSTHSQIAYALGYTPRGVLAGLRAVAAESNRNSTQPEFKSQG